MSEANGTLGRGFPNGPTLKASKNLMNNGYILAPLCLVLILTGFATGQHRREDQALTDELYALVDKRSELIRQSISGTSNEWAGTYAAGDHHPTIFMWTPEEGFLVTSSHHTFSPSWINYGEVLINAPFLSVRPVLTKDDNYAHVIDTEFRMVKWGQHHFLIPPNDLRSFAYTVHSRAESEIIHYFSRWEDRDKQRRGLPNLPPEFTKYLKMAPIIARITAVDDSTEEVTISVGRRHNVIEGMIFYFTPQRGSQFSIRVTSVSETEAKGDVSSRAITGSGEEVRIRRGLKLTSRIPRGFIEPG